MLEGRDRWVNGTAYRAFELVGPVGRYARNIEYFWINDPAHERMISVLALK